MTLSLASRRKAPPPPTLNLDFIRREETRDAPKTPPGPLTPNRPLVISSLPDVSLPAPSAEPSTFLTTSTIPETPPATPTQPPEPPRKPTPPSTPTSSTPPDITFPTLLPPGTTLLTSKSNTTQHPPSPTNTIFITVVPEPVTITRDAAAPAPTPPNPVIPSAPQGDTKPRPSAAPSNSGVSFTTGSGVVVLGVLGGVALSSILVMMAIIVWRKRKRRRPRPESSGALMAEAQ
ncbi:hypothetical protein CPLU01_10035 [Colletotrichum plurivorum]|uniref:Uncharacterized protein n=1 Tax=Colletotrichum plurivorum TaxID=2175906 RepID=A0A8H6K6W9_9PEZI|nr:hypothetical protein CPLU01_10035 [Colletotrichum plurivorum]